MFFLCFCKKFDSFPFFLRRKWEKQGFRYFLCLFHTFLNLGQIPQIFLFIQKLGTLSIHKSNLPLRLGNQSRDGSGIDFRLGEEQKVNFSPLDFTLRNSNFMKQISKTCHLEKIFHLIGQITLTVCQLILQIHLFFSTD